MAITFFPTPKHRVFNYQPRYYDERKERLREIYAKYGKEYPGDEKANAHKAAEDLKDVASYSEVNELLQSEGPREGRYIPGQYIRSTYHDDRDKRRSSAKKSPLRKIVIIVTVLAAVVAAYYLSQGLVMFFK